MSRVRTLSLVCCFLCEGLAVQHLYASPFVKQQEQKPSTAAIPEQAFINIILEEGVQRARQVYLETKRRNPEDVLFREPTLNALGYRFIREFKRVQDAIEIFKLNTEAYPASANAYDSLAEGYLTAGQNDLAIQHYRKSLELNPRNGNAVQALARLQIRLPADRWRDGSPHRSRFVRVNGVRLHYLDWRGRGEPLLFLAGFGDSAHIYDDIALKFTDRFRVLALTRRGHGQSDKPQTGYDLDTLVEDILKFLDALKIKRVNLVGHSFAGYELTIFASRYPARVGKLVFLDAVHNFSDLTDDDIVSAVPGVYDLLSPGLHDVASLDAYRKWLMVKRFGFWSKAQEANLRVTSFTPGGKFKTPLEDRVVAALAKGQLTSHPDLTMVKAPALSFQMISTVSSYFPWLSLGAGEEQKKAQTFLNRTLTPNQRKQVDRFRREVVGGRVIEMPGTHHYLFITKEPEVVGEIRAFLLKGVS